MSEGGIAATTADRGSAVADLDAFVYAHYDRIVRLAGLICVNQEDAFDAVQSALERAWRHQESVRNRDRLASWVDRIVVREASRIERRRQFRVRFLVGWQPVQFVHPADQGPRDSAFRDAFRSLSADQRAAIALHFDAGYSIAETAELTGVPLETARSRIRLAKAKLRDRLDLENRREKEGSDEA